MKLSTLCLTLLITASTPTIAKGPATSDAQIRKAIIAESISSYPSNCPCPYNTARNGSSCGRRSAYSKVGGYAPICYDKDVTKQMIAEYKATHR
ncbi:hypothetical protein EBA01_19855 [Xanthomonas oryzae pv. oryzae]|uniref:hypothetical protein n=1 Tax=Xanthomonas oryzae TaxID=347 RepID=UPI000D1B2B5E|nr:hypothetical protein [Xanthomonas oryzae]AVU00533.1 hypothetical protein C0L89_19865 [Xanthomonas oryzae pv. oryzae]QBN29815.1 hypothetical protein EBA01_19855 [Xanthomonas oryzae pv. oryzae]QBN62560.1 hypothetical protein EBA10_19870 [Xanthomonas oryzae pv. oryzae]QBN66205.1 hypothetical protein EBA11_19825 [Xanthomonas oryzae pv. oryzae]